MIELQRNVPPPIPKPRIDARKKYPFDTMQVDDFFFVPGKTTNSIRTYFVTVGKQYGIKLTSKLIHARKIDEQWRPCEEGDNDATTGVGVWRTE